jgi:3-hydroxy-9,10-secoandrosta-1,3,5(10)-triene-9,17-dione monooxygenase
VARYEVSLSWVYGITALVGAFVGYSALEQILYRCADELMNMARERRTGRQGKVFARRAYIVCRARGRRQPGRSCRGTVQSDNDPLQRFWRDVHVMGQHVALNHEAGMRNYGRVLMVLDSDVPVY